jgi:glutaredoxin
MRLIVCWSTGGGAHHACGAAYTALKDAGHDPEVQKAYSTRLVPDALQVTAGRKEAKRRTGKTDVPVLILDDDTTVAGSKPIAEWARANPAGAQAGAPSPKPAA